MSSDAPASGFEFQFDAPVQVLHEIAIVGVEGGIKMRATDKDNCLARRVPYSTKMLPAGEDMFLCHLSLESGSRKSTVHQSLIRAPETQFIVSR